MFQSVMLYVSVVVFMVNGWNGRRVTPEECVLIRKQGVRTMTTQFGDWYRLTKGLYVGNVCAAHQDEWLDEKNISTVISLAEEWDTLPYKGERKIQFYHFPTPDSKTDDDQFSDDKVRNVTLLIHNIIYLGYLPEYLYDGFEAKPPRVFLFSHLCISLESKIIRWYRRHFPYDGLCNRFCGGEE